MRSIRRSALVALVLVSALVVVASPAFATPNLTASSGNRSPVPPNTHSPDAVAPFITPSTNTRSLYTAYSTDSQFVLAALGVTLSCVDSNVSGYATITHTQFRLTSISFGNGRDPRNCTVRPAGTVDVQPITCTATSRDPWFFHVRASEDTLLRRSASGTINTTSSCTVRTTIGGTADAISVDANQSCRPGPSGIAVLYTWAGGRESLVIDCVFVVTISGGVRLSTTANFRGTYTIRPDTRTDASLTVTSSS
jgi:hypothetical protein